MTEDEKIDLIMAEAKAEAAKISQTTPLIEACADEKAAKVSQLIKEGADVNQADKFGRTPLHHAVRYAYIDEAAALKIVTQLLDSGAEIDAVEKENKQTPLHEAAIYKYEPLVRLLLEPGANPNLRMKDKKTVVGVITVNSTMLKGRKKILKILEDAGGKV